MSHELPSTSRSELLARFWDQLPAIPQPDKNLRRHLAHLWLDAARNEHASVASFSGFSLSLLALGAPPQLLEICHRAALEEVEHARICFALASHFAGTPLGPGPLPIPAVPPELDPAQVLIQTIADGCIGEALSAAEAAAAAERCDIETLALAFQIIAHDEAIHAGLAWMFVGWLVEVKPQLIGTALEAFQSFTGLVGAPPSSSVYESLLPGYGQLSIGERLHVRRATLRDHIEPSLKALAARYKYAN